MTPEEIQAMAKGLSEGQAVWYFGSAVIGGVIAAAGTYLAEKGKNRATSEDIAAITRKIEEVKTEYSRQMEDLKAHHQLRMVAAERRMQAHQEAYLHWVSLSSAVLQSGKFEVYAKADDLKLWYSSNCIYLTTTSREAVRATWTCVYASYAYEQTGNQDAYMANSQKLQDLGNVFLREVDLPVLSRGELNAVAEMQDAAPLG